MRIHYQGVDPPRHYEPSFGESLNGLPRLPERYDRLKHWARAAGLRCRVIFGGKLVRECDLLLAWRHAVLDAREQVIRERRREAFLRSPFANLWSAVRCTDSLRAAIAAIVELNRRAHAALATTEVRFSALARGTCRRGNVGKLG